MQRWWLHCVPWKKQASNSIKTLECIRPIHNPIKKNLLALFKRPHPKATSKTGKNIKVLQNNVALFGQLYISMKSRDGDLKEFYAHEIQSFPPSLSDFGKLYLRSTKSDILKSLEKLRLYSAGWCCYRPLTANC